MTTRNDAVAADRSPARDPGWWVRIARGGVRPWRRIGIALGGVALLTVAMLPFRESLGVLNVLLLYLILSLVLGLYVGVKAAATGAVLAFVAYDFFFIPPYHTLTVADTDHVLGLFVYLGVAIGAAFLMAQLRAQTDTTIRESARTTLLYDLNRSLVGDVSLDSLLHTIAERVVAIYGSVGCRILVVHDGGDLQVGAAYPTDRQAGLDRQSLTMARFALDQRTPAGLGTRNRQIRKPHGTVRIRGTSAVRSRDALYIPIATSARSLGVLEVTGRPGGGKFTRDDERLLTSFGDQVALAMERTRLSEEATRTAVLEESDRLKSAVLAAVSHDLRTPLAAIKASASTLRDTSVEWGPEVREELLGAIEEETDRLTLMVSNLLDLSRIEGGALRPDRGWNDVGELVHDVERQVRPRLGERRLTVTLPDEMPLVSFDYVEIGQVLLNLVGNAIKYSDPGTAIAILIDVREEEVEFVVRDEGMGILPAELPFVFDPFVRGHDQAPATGSGIGLAICKGLVEAHGGRIWAESEPGVGTIMRFTLPRKDPG